ncbi:MAG: acyl-CoA carboxylase epsilon subunit [Egicoccus sp.]
MADIRVLHGSPTDHEVAALVVALTPVADDGVTGDGGGPTMPAWTRAALLEGTGGATVHAPDGLLRTQG